MSKTKLFDAWTFKLALPEPFDDPQYSGAKDFGLSQYNQTGRVRKATLHAPTLRALLAYAKLQSASEQGQSTEQLGAIGHQDSNFKIAEYESANKTDCVVFSPIQLVDRLHFGTKENELLHGIKAEAMTFAKAWGRKLSNCYVSLLNGLLKLAGSIHFVNTVSDLVSLFRFIH